jgi:hypothetical protein
MLNYSMGRVRVRRQQNTVDDSLQVEKDSGSSKIKIDADMNVGKMVAVLGMFIIMFILPAYIFETGLPGVEVPFLEQNNTRNYANNVIESEQTQQTGEVLGAATTNSQASSSTQNSNSTLAAILLLAGGATIVSSSIIYSRL